MVEVSASQAYRVAWSPEDGEHVGLCAEYPSLSWLASTPEEALSGIRLLVADCEEDMRSNGEELPDPAGKDAGAPSRGRRVRGETSSPRRGRERGPGGL